MSAPTSTLVDILWAGRPAQIETLWVGPARQPGGPAPLIFLHEGLGSVAMWRDFPAVLCERLGRPGLVYSRPAYGRSTPRAVDEAWGLDFMHRQSEEVLPALLEALDEGAGAEEAAALGGAEGVGVGAGGAGEAHRARAGAPGFRGGRRFRRHRRRTC